MACSITEKCSLCFIFALIFSFFIFQVASCSFFFFFQAEDGIRDHCVTGVQTYALPISKPVEFQGEARISVHRHKLEKGVIYRLRSEEHTSELQSHSDIVCRLLLEK